MVRHRQPGRQPRVELVEPVLLAVLRAQDPAVRGEVMCGLWACARQLIQSSERARQPDLDGAQLAPRVARRMSGGSA